MRESRKYLIAMLAVFFGMALSIIILQMIGAEAAGVLDFVYTLLFSAVLAGICIYLGYRHRDFRRYYVSLSWIMLSYCFADLYLGLHLTLRSLDYIYVINMPIAVISYLGSSAFIAALCARIWFEEIPKSEVHPLKANLVSAAAVGFILVISAVGIVSGYPPVPGILYMIFSMVGIWYSVRFFTVSKSVVNPFLPIMILITAFLVYEALWTNLLIFVPDIPGIVDTVLSYPMTLAQVLLIPFLLLAEERKKKVNCVNGRF